MCFDKKTSIIVFSLGILAATKVIYDAPKNNQQITTGIFIILISIMQLVEYFLWSYQGSDKYSLNMNRFWSYMILITLFLQVIVYYFVNVYFGLISDPLIIFYISGLSIFFILTLVYVYKSEKKVGILQTRPSKGSCRLLWGVFDNRTNMLNITSRLFRIFYLLSMMYLLWINYGWKSLILVATIIPAILYTIYYQRDFNAVYGSIWCFSIVIICILVVLFNIDLSKN